MCHLASWQLSTWSMQQTFKLTSRCIFPSVHSIMLIFCIFITVICLYIAILFVLFCLANMFNQIVWAVWHLPMICSLIYRMSFFLWFKRYFIFMTLVKSAPLPRQHHPSACHSLPGCVFKGTTGCPSTPRANDLDGARAGRRRLSGGQSGWMLNLFDLSRSLFLSDECPKIHLAFVYFFIFIFLPSCCATQLLHVWLRFILTRRWCSAAVFELLWRRSDPRRCSVDRGARLLFEGRS